ncbi:MAG TPA: penicillin-binding transpeptidase domain-containing protein [Deltaproteobacteria bacterium]|mgnify:FL=1|nr:penicillin-binding transpeptidase domain-containing protein [Deltaproteobacteria bacterium]HRR21483.1 penicillin-binding transpeptidase domain-containing protein [Desulfomonilia bacterium]HON61423.1 penicillin-binding transpeptidase domain-containing protein [Deltaproteobacteria bacterium]HPA85980.1 penicillin-binding transpeptidase domain-containing protein [Deltaproteobacteria bacterium]HPL85641.1 penicillin-binding transpeptidase domain-containing protein [Deltaproteobacteria bacterium]
MKRRKRRFLRLRYPLLLALAAVALFSFYPESECTTGVSRKNEPPATSAAARQGMPVSRHVRALSRQDLVHIDEEIVKRRSLTIDWDLQKFVIDTAAKYKMCYGAVVVMDARSGDILVLYGRNREESDCSLGLEPELGASIFKLVTAVAAIEQAGFTAESMFFYTGSAYTLYKQQLTNKRNRWCEDISLADAFAKSNNVVFGKLGSMYMGREPIVLTAERMGFGKSLLREFEITPSVSYLPKDDYGAAELACGFNRQTRISPLHAAQMVTAVLNGGHMITPRLVRGQSVEKTQVMKRSTAEALADMMERTVRKGTVAKTFRGCSSDRVLKHLTIGGKSGSIGGTDPDGRRNWFIGYARHRDTGEGITVGCLLILEDRYWIEADMLSRIIIRRYFSRAASGDRTACALGGQ